MQVAVLGPLLVRADGHEVTPRGQRLRDVLTVLLQRRGRPVAPEVVLDLVWGEQASELGAAAVHTVVSRLRRQLGPTVIRTHDAGYLVDRSTTTDADSFGELTDQACRRFDLQDWAGAARGYRDALAHWRGEQSFAGVSDELVEADRARLAELRAGVVEDLASLLVDHPDCGEPGEALRLVTDLIAAQPLRERPYQIAMLANYRAHRQAEALAAFAALDRRLRTELGVEPSPTTSTLHTRILRHDAALLIADPVPARPSTPVRPRVTCLPAPVNPLVGRDDELIKVLGALDGGRRMVTIVGPAGVGKSRLLAEIATRHTGDRRVMFADLSGLQVRAPVELAEAMALGYGLAITRDGPLASIAAALGDDPWLVLVDEAEVVADALSGVLQDVIDLCPGVQVVVTSRRPLDLAGESLVALAPLECPSDDATADAIAASPAVRLLSERLTDRAVPAGTDPDSLRLLAAIARRVDGLPLALELAAGQASTRSLAELAELVHEPLDVPAVQRPRADRHRSLRAALGASVDLLGPIERTVLRRLGVFAGTFDSAAARAVVGPLDGPRDNAGAGHGDSAAGAVAVDIAAVLGTLTRDALVRVDRRHPGRLGFRLLRTIRDLALDQLGPVELATARARHRRWHADRWRGRQRRDDLLTDVRDHYEDYLEALRSALDDGDATTLADLTLTLCELWRFASAGGPGLQWTTAALDAGVLGPLERAQVLAERAALGLHHDPDMVLADTDAAIPVLQAAGDQDSLVLACRIRALEQHFAGQHADAIRHADMAVRVARSAGSDRLGHALSVQAVIHAAVGDAATAERAMVEARRVVDGTGSASDRILVGNNVAFALLDIGRAADALDLLATLDPDVGRIIGSTPPHILTFTTAWAALGAGQPTRALSCFLALLGDDRPVPADRFGAEIAVGIGCALDALGDRAAPALLADARELAQAVGLRPLPQLGRTINAAIERAGVSGAADRAATGRLDTAALAAAHRVSRRLAAWSTHPASA